LKKGTNWFYRRKTRLIAAGVYLKVLNLIRNRVLNSCRILSPTQLNTAPHPLPATHCMFCIILPYIQGADNKLGQFLGQDIEATANHRKVLRHSLESYSSLVSCNVSKPSLDTKICRQSTKLLQLSKKLYAPRRDQQGIEKFLKVHRSLVYLLKTVLYQNQDTGEADVTPV
jgi:hypothetical protein